MLVYVSMRKSKPRPYQRIAAELRAAIRGGKYAPGDPIPSVTQLQRETGHAVMTVRAARQQLVDEGYVRIVSGKGTFVTPRESWPAAPAPQA